MQSHCLKLLKVKNLGELRDRFEGQKFLDNALNKVSAYFACVNFLGVSKLSLEQVLQNDDISIEFNGAFYKMLLFNFGELQQVSSVYCPQIFILKKDKQTFSICGTATVAVLIDDLNYKTEKGKRFFVGFENLLGLRK